MIDRQEFEIQKLRHQDMRRQTAQMEMVRLARSDARRSSAVAPVMRYLGKKLVLIGTVIEKKYGSLVEEAQNAGAEPRVRAPGSSAQV